MIVHYVHHHGSGHMHRALCIAERCPVPITGVSSLDRPKGWRGRWVKLPDDRPAGGDVDATAGGTLHWAPRMHDGVRARARALSSVLADPEVRLFVSDVSVEAAVLARLHGVPVVVVYQPGARDDRAHRTAYDLADAILAAVPGPGPSWWPDPWHAKACHVGAFGRFDARVPEPPVRSRKVLVLAGQGGVAGDLMDLVDDAARATPGWAWAGVGRQHRAQREPPPNVTWQPWVEDPWPLLCEAEVVVTHAGQNALAEVAAARRPAVIIPEPRPFGEQDATARLLAGVAPASIATRWPGRDAWPQLLEATSSLPAGDWRRWSSGDGARAAATRLVELWERA